MFVAVEDGNFLKGFRRSWALTRGRRLRPFALGLVARLVFLLVPIAFAIPSVFLPAVLGFLIEGIGVAPHRLPVAAVAETDNRLVPIETEAEPTAE